MYIIKQLDKEKNAIAQLGEEKWPVDVLQINRALRIKVDTLPVKTK
jgi:hypothetical protein